MKRRDFTYLEFIIGDISHEILMNLQMSKFSTSYINISVGLLLENRFFFFELRGDFLWSSCFYNLDILEKFDLTVLDIFECKVNLLLLSSDLLSFMSLRESFSKLSL